MDLKFKGATWVGNIYQKFEAMCHEVDDYVRQDTVKYVENQVQTVGESVKKIYSGVVQDLLPSSLVETREHKTQTASSETKDIGGTYVISMIGDEETPLYTEINDSSVEIDQCDHLENKDDQFIHLTFADCVRQADSDLCFGPETNVLKDEKADIVLEENYITEELMHRKYNTILEENGTKEEVVKPDINVVLNDTTEELIDKKSGRFVKRNETEELSLPEELVLICPENKVFSEGSLSTESIDENNGILAEVPFRALVCHTQKDETASSILSDEVDCIYEISSMLPPSEMHLSVISGVNNKTSETVLISSGSSVSTGNCSMPEFSTENIPQNQENTCLSCESISNLLDAPSSSQPPPSLSCDNKAQRMRLAFSSSALSLESKDLDTPTTDGAACLAGSSENRQNCCFECSQLETLISALEIGEADKCSLDISDPDMETISLCEKTELGESCVIADNKVLYALSCRAQKYRSYKKILQDAFVSKKRLRKEYKLLAILYGDIDKEFSQLPGQYPLPSAPTSSLGSTKSSHDLCDPEWELL